MIVVEDICLALPLLVVWISALQTEGLKKRPPNPRERERDPLARPALPARVKPRLARRGVPLVRPGASGSRPAPVGKRGKEGAFDQGAFC